MSSLLMVYLSSDWRSHGQLPWTLRDAFGKVVSHGQCMPGDLPAARETVGIVAQDALLLRRVKLPAGREARESNVLAYSIEDALLTDPDAVHVSVLGPDGEGLSVVAAVSRSWIHETVTALQGAGRVLRALVPEGFLLPFKAGAWSVLVGPGAGMVRTGDSYALATDALTGREPPVTLRLMAAEARAAGKLPSRVRVFVSDKDQEIDARFWQSVLGVPVVLKGRWQWADAPPAAALPTLLAGRLGAKGNGLEKLRPYRPVFWALGLMLGLQVLAVLGTWGWMSWERRALRSEMEALFTQAFPDAKAIVDPPLQMQRNLTQLRRGAGEAGPEDFLVQLGQVAPELGSLPPGVVKSVQFAQGRLTVEMAAPAEAVAALQGQLGARGVRASVEAGQGGAGARLVLRGGAP